MFEAKISQHSNDTQCHEHFQSNNCHNGAHCVLISTQLSLVFFIIHDEVAQYSAQLVSM